MKKLVISCMVVLAMLLVVVSCAKPPTPARGPAPRPGPQIFIEADAATDKDSYLPGQDIVIELSFKNVTSEPFEIEPFPPLIQIMRPHPYDEPVRSFPAGTGTKSLEPGEVAGYTLTWNQSDDQEQQVAYGHYYLKLGDIRHGDGWMSVSFGRYVQLLILPAEGVIEKTIEVNESRTVGGITITLKRVELTTTEAKFYAFNVPPDYNLPQGPNLPPPQFMIHAEAEYKLDGGVAKKAGLSGIRFLADGMEHIWDMLDPVPKGTGELTFAITRLGEWEGLWEFQVSLE